MAHDSKVRMFLADASRRRHASAVWLVVIVVSIVVGMGCGQKAPAPGQKGDTAAPKSAAQSSASANPVQALPSKADAPQSSATPASKSDVVPAGNWRVLDTRTDLADHARAKQNVEDTLIKYPNIGCLVGLWSYNGPAILSAVKNAGKQGKVPIVCFDEEDDTMQGVIDGHILGTVVQQPFLFGYESVHVLSALAKGDKSLIPESKVIDIPVRDIRKANAQEFWDNLKQMVAAKTEAKPAEGGEKIRLAFVTNNVSVFWQIAKAGVRKAEAEFGVTCEFQMPPEGTPADQLRLVEALTAKGISGMAISPVDPANQLDMLNRACEKMNVITQDSDAPQSKRICYVGTNNYKAGRLAGKLIKEALPNGGDLMLFVGRIDAQNAVERRQGILDELAGK